MMYEFVVTLATTKGPFRIKTWATDWVKAVEITLNFEGAPVTALVGVEQWS